MEFFEDNDEVVSFWNPQSHFQGFGNVLHGGIISSLCDELACRVVFIHLKTAGVTSKIETRYKKPLFINNGQITLRGKIIETKRNLAIIKVKVFDSSGNLCAGTTAYYFTLPPEEAKKQLYLPGVSAFYE